MQCSIYITGLDRCGQLKGSLHDDLTKTSGAFVQLHLNNMEINKRTKLNEFVR